MIEKVVFIDRDGVINEDPGGYTKFGYVTEWPDFKFFAGGFGGICAIKKSRL